MEKVGVQITCMIAVLRLLIGVRKLPPPEVALELPATTTIRDAINVRPGDAAVVPLI